MSEHPSYQPNGDGTYTSATPCAVCGSPAFILADTPRCITCFTTADKAAVAAEVILGGLHQLLEIVDRLPDTTRLILRNDLAAAVETIDWILVAMDLVA